MEIKS
jgi:hypothetical protein